jgi:manganese transport system substrate-binding protein
MERSWGLNYVWNRPTSDVSHSTLRGGVNCRIIRLALLIGLCLSGCGTQGSRNGEGTTSPNQPNRQVVLTTFTVIADMTKNVAGDKIGVESIVKPGAEIHGYEPTPSDLSRGQGAKAILDNGFNLERWATRFYNSFPKVPHITLSEGIVPVEIGGDAYKGKPNPHAWMSPKNALIYVENIRKALGNLDPVNAKTYDANALNYSQQIRALDTKLKQAIATVPADKRYLVSCEGAFTYIARDYGLTEVYIWPVNAEQQATPKQVERVINTVRAKQIPAVFCESTVDNRAQLQVAKETGAKFGGVFYVDSLSPPNGPASTYLKLLEYNINTLIGGLKAK